MLNDECSHSNLTLKERLNSVLLELIQAYALYDMMHCGYTRVGASLCVRLKISFSTEKICTVYTRAKHVHRQLILYGPS